MSGGFFSLASELLWWVCKLRSSPAPGNAPLGNQGTREPTGCVLSKVGQSSRWSCCHWILGKECTLLTSRRSELLDLHFHRRPRPEFQDTVGKTCRTTKSEDKGKRPPIQKRIAQGDNLQITKLGDDQERRPTPSQVAQNERERVIGQHEEKTQWMRTARKVQQRKPAPPMRKNRPEQKNTKKTETASKTGANQKTCP